MPNPPSTWQQLLQPQYKGLVGMNDPSQSGPTFPFIAGMMNYLGGVSSGDGRSRMCRARDWSTVNAAASLRSTSLRT